MENGASHIYVDGHRNYRCDIRRRRVIDNLWQWVRSRFIQARTNKQPGTRPQGENSNDQNDCLALREFLHSSEDPLTVECPPVSCPPSSISKSSALSGNFP